MDQVTAVRQCVSLEQWQSVITECRSSGIPVKKWCKDNGVCEQTYYRKLKLLRQREIEKMPNNLVPRVKEKTPSFKKLEVISPVSDTKAAVIIHWNGISVEVHEGVSQQTVQTVLLALRSLC